MNTNQFISIFFQTLLLTCLYSFSFSQEYNFRNYSVEQGLSQSQVYAMCEDKNGNIWFGTRGGGLSRFDGISFTNYTVQEGLPGNYIKTIIRDTSGNLWIGTDDGLSRYDGKRFTNYTSEQGLYNTTINALTFDRKGTLWIGTQKGIFHLEGDTIVRFGRKTGSPMERISALAEDRDGKVWAGTDFGLFCFERKGESWDMLQLTTKEGLPNNLVTAVTAIPTGGIWVCTYGGGVAKIKKDNIQIISGKNGLTSNTVFTCAVDADGAVWFGTAYGITRCQFSGTDSLYSVKAISETEGLANHVVMSILKDSFGNTWFGTSGGGVSRLDSERFKHYTAIKGVFGSWVYSIAQDREGKMWFGTSEGGVTQYDGNYYKRFSERNEFTSSKVKCIHEDVQGNLWLGTIADGVYLYNGKTFRHFNRKNGLSSNFINYMISDTSGMVWMATAGGGISCLIPDGNNTYRVKNIRPREGLASDRIHTLLMDSAGAVWAGTANGKVCRIYYSPSEDKFSIDNFSSGSSGIRCAVIDNQGLMYFGTADAGVTVFDGKKFIPWKKDRGLASNNIYSLIFDNQGNLWVGTEKGIDKILFSGPQKIKEVRHYGKPEGFTGIETIQNSICKDKEGNIWFGNVRSATVFNPSKEKDIRLPKVHITGINLFFDKIENTPFGKNLSSWYQLPQSLILPYDQNHLSFEFIGIEQSNPEAVRYRWMLEGFDESWSPVTSRREAVYSNLPPGEYTFKLLAANERKEWISSPVSYSFIIQPPLWKTWWFRLFSITVSVLLAGLMIAYAFRWEREKNKKERQKLEAERTLIELEQKALRLQMNPHFLFNCLNSIKGLIAENKQEEAKIYLSRFAKLMRTMLDNSREAFISLQSEIAGLNTYAELEKLSREDKFDFYIQVSKDIDSSSLQIPPMLIQPFVENAIIHGIAPKEGKGKVAVSFEPEGEYLKCKIEDNGIGREKASQMKRESMQKHKSAAIAVTQERLNIINKKLNFGEVKILIHDLKNEQQEGTGTRVELFIPYRRI